MESSSEGADVPREVMDPPSPYVLVTVEWLDGKQDYFYIGERQEYGGWSNRPDENRLVFKTHRMVNRTVVPLGNVRLYSVNRFPAEPREK